MERTRKIQASFNPPHLPRATQPPLPPSSTFSSRHSAETYTATYGGTRSRHACRRRVGAKVRDLLVQAPASSTKTEFSKQLGLAKPLPEVQLLSEVNVSRKLLSETQRKAHENRIPGSKSAWDIKQYLDPEQGGTERALLTVKASVLRRQGRLHGATSLFHHGFKFTAAFVCEVLLHLAGAAGVALRADSQVLP